MHVNTIGRRFQILYRRLLERQVQTDQIQRDLAQEQSVTDYRQ